LLLLPALIIIGVIYIVPLGQIAYLSIRGSEFSPAEYAQLAGDEVIHLIFLRTIWIAVVVTAVSLLIGYPVAFLILRAPKKLAAVLLLLVVIPMWTSILVRSYSWMVILGREGIVNSVLQSVGFTEGPLKLLFNRFSVYVGMIHIMLPFMVLPILNTLRQIEPSLNEAATSLGATPVRSFFVVFLPLSLPGIAAGCALVSILSLGFFVTPALLGGLTETTFVMLIERYVNALRDWEQASAMSVVLMAVTMVLIVVAQYNPSREDADRVRSKPSAWTRAIFHGANFLNDALTRIAQRIRGAKADHAADAGSLTRFSARPHASSRRRRTGWFVRILGYGGLVFLCFPLVIIFILAFSDSPFLKFPPTGLSLRWFENYFARPDWTGATLTSFKVALMTMVIATVVGTLAATAVVRFDFPGKGLLVGLMISPIVVPTVVLAIAIYFLYARLGLVGSYIGLVAAHVVLAIPFVLVVVSSALRSVDTTLERAAQTLGASPVSAFVRITIPAIRPAILTAGFFAFLASFDELVVALFIAGTGSKTLPKRMWEGIREEIDPTTAAVAAMLITLTLVLLLVSELVRSRMK
jgi:putative spermidine/putrescine transport system permease protein